MLAVRPVPEIKTAKELCLLCGADHNDGDFTYFASDVNDDATKINYIIGVCTFAIKGDTGVIKSLENAAGIEDDEAMIIMARTVMNFMYRCEVLFVTVDENTVSKEMTEKLGFPKVADGYRINLADFYASQCKYKV